MKCDICKKTVEETFLKKPIGTHIRDSKGKRRTVCSECQAKFPKKEDLLAQL
jgi:hypothetical protein